MRKKLLGLCFIVVAYSGFLLLTLPAKLVLSYASLPLEIRIDQVSGTIWQGHAERVSWTDVSIHDVSWDTTLTALFRGALEANVTFGRGKQSLRGQGDVGVTLSGAYARDVTLMANAEWLVLASKIPVPVTTLGEVKLQVSEFAQGLPWCQQLSGQLSWSNAGIESLLGNIDLANASAKLSCDNGNVVANIKQLSDHLQLSGVATLAARGQYNLNAVLVAGPALPASIRNNLHYLGAPNAQGEYKLNYSGRL